MWDTLKEDEQHEGYFELFIYTVSFLVMLSLYTKHVFPELSSAFGGGKKQKVEFVVKAEQLETAKAIGLKVEPDKYLSKSNTVF